MPGFDCAGKNIGIESSVPLAKDLLIFKTHEKRDAQISPGRLELQLTILIFSAWIGFWLSSLKLTSLIRNVHTSSQKR